ncbi:MAG: UPF0182 family protein [Coriobacteriia bacterium]
MARSRSDGARPVLAVVAIAIFVVLVASTGVATFFTDILWFREMGQEAVFWTTLSSRWAIGTIFTVVMFALLFVNVRIARSLAPRIDLRLLEPETPLTVGDVPIRLQLTFAELKQRLDPWIDRGLLAGCALLALAAGTPMAARWHVFRLALARVPFGATDPQFGRDIGFYVFTYPALRAAESWLLSAFVLALVVTAAVHLLDGAIRPGDRLRGFDPHVKAHLSVLAGLIVLVKGFGYWLDMFGLNFSPRGQVLGASFTDVHAQMPALRILIVIAVLSGLALLVNIRFKGWRLPAAAIGLWVGASIIVGGIYPAIIQQFRVTPNEVAAEAPYIKRNIEGTRKAYDLEAIEVRPFAAAESLTASDLAANRQTVDNVRLWDPSIVVQSYKQLQEIRPYYDFKDVDIDRYRIDGTRQEVLVSVREMNVGQLAEQAKTWVNQHLVYTHGYGVVVSPVNEVSPTGLPRFIVRDIPPTTTTDLHVTQPAIYFGEEEGEYAIAPTGIKEFDYPLGDRNANASYAGKAGIPIGGLSRRIAFALRFGAPQLLFSSYVTPESKVLLRRALTERVGALAPWLALDSDPYASVVDGHVVWILDGYTTSSYYPYSQRTGGDVNYIRNSVKVTVDAFDGTTTLYAFDEKDPVLRAWRAVFPTLFADAAKMPAGVRAHLRYPEDLFRVQAEIYKTYHMRDPQVFYNKEDSWAIPGENSADGAMAPFYVLMRLPGESDETFMLMLPFTPRNKDNMIGWMAAKADPSDYGRRVVYTFPKQKLVLGPEQVSARINQDPVISQQLTLWNQRGSSVLFGNMLVLPMDQSLLFIQPLYLQAEKTAMPELTRVLVVFADRVAMEPDLATALAKVFGTAPAGTELSSGGQTAGNASTGTATPAGDLATARSLYEKALAAQRSGDWAAYGRYIEELGRVLSKMTGSAAATATP